MSSSKQLLLLMMLLIGGWAVLRYYHQQPRLYRQLEELTAVLAIENNLAAEGNSNTVKSIEAAVIRNRNQPTQVAQLRRAKGLQASVDQILNTLQTCGNQLRSDTNNPFGGSGLQHPSTAAGPALSPAHQQALQRQLTACTDTLRHISTTKAIPLALPILEETTPVVEVLAAISQLESVILSYEKPALQRILKSVVYKSLVLKLSAAATAQSNVIAPGETYHAELILVGHYPVAAHMTCNGHPIPVTPDGIGQVSFRAPKHPGPATWRGTVSFKRYGRDTTFQVTVPYRVANR